MLSVAAVLFSLGSVAFLAEASRRLRQLGSVVSAGLALGAGVHGFGPLRGGVVFLLTAMTAASVLVLLLPPRPRYAWPSALAFSGLGLAALAASLWSGPT